MKPAVVSDQAARELEILRAIKKPSGRDKFIFSNRHNIPFSIDRIISNFKKGVIRAGLSRPAYTPYWLRHTFNTRMLEILPDETVRLLMGHATEAMTRHYYHPDIDSLRTEAKKIIENFDAVKDQWGA